MSREPQSEEEALEVFVTSWRSGARADPAEFVARHAHLGDELGSAIEAWLAFEGAGVLEADAEGSRIGPYRVLREIGRGGMGVVYDAVEEPLGRRVALKVLPPTSLASASARGRFRRESELAARLDHPGIATVYGVGVESERPWIAMRFVEGRTLDDAIVDARDAGASCARVVPRRDGVPDARERDALIAVASCVARVARALQAAHEHGVVHRDVKPSNVVVGADGAPVLVDFGLAIQEESSGHTLSRSGEHSGTPAYFAPELVSGERARSDAQTDVYALGVTLYECLVLRRPFEAPTPVALFRAILTEEPADPRARNVAIPTDLAVVARTALERDRARRYANAAALADDLEACVAGRPIRARPVPLTGRIARWARREPRQATFAGAFLVAAIVALALGGTWLSSRGEVRAAAEVARLRARDDALARGFVMTHDQRRARAEFDRALELDAQSLDALAGKALTFLASRRNRDALDLLANAPRSLGFDALRTAAEGRELALDRPASAQSPAGALDLFVVANILYYEASALGPTARRARYRLAREYVDEAIVRSPAARQSHHALRAELATQLAEAGTKRSAATTLLDLWPDSPSAWWAAAGALMSLEPERAIELLRRVTLADADNPYPFVALGQVLTGVGRLDEAEIALRRGIELLDSANANLALGVLLHERGCVDEARASYERALALDPRDFAAWNNLGLLAHEADDNERALPCFQETLAIDPWFAGGHAVVGLILRRSGRAAEALPHLEHALGLDPRLTTQTWEQLARAHDELGDVDGTRAALEEGIRWFPQNELLPRLLDSVASQE